MDNMKKDIALAEVAALEIDYEKRFKQLRPIFRAVINRDIRTIEELLESGSDPNEVDNTPNKYTVAHWAAMVKDNDVLPLLHKFKINLSAVDVNCMTPLHVAALAGNCEAFTWLLDKTKNIEVREIHNQTPLHLAALNGRIEVVKMLLNLGASIDAVDRFGMTPICFALLRRYTDIVVLFLEHGANPGVRDNKNKSLLHIAAANDDTLVISLLLKKGIDVNATDNDKFTPLHDAAKHGSCQSARFLFSNGAKVDAEDSQGHTPFYRAKEAGHMDFLSMLLSLTIDVGADVPEEIDNYSALKDWFLMEAPMEVDSYNETKDAADHENMENGDEHCRGLPSSVISEGANHMENETCQMECLTEPTPAEDGDHHMEGGNCAFAQDKGFLDAHACQIQDRDVCIKNNILIHDEANSSEYDDSIPTFDLTFDDIMKIII